MEVEEIQSSTSPAPAPPPARASLFGVSDSSHTTPGVTIAHPALVLPACPACAYCWKYVAATSCGESDFVRCSSNWKHVQYFARHSLCVSLMKLSAAGTSTGSSTGISRALFAVAVVLGVLGGMILAMLLVLAVFACRPRRRRQVIKSEPPALKGA